MKPFRAEVGPVGFDKNKVVVKLILENATPDMIGEFFVKRGEKMDFMTGSPQMSMDDYGVGLQQRSGITATIGPNGVVESIKKQEDEEKLEDLCDGQEEHDQDQIEEDEAGSDDFEMEFDGHEETDEIEDSEELIEYIENRHNDQQQEPDRDEIEMFIMNYGPHFPQVQYDFPELLRRKRSGETWIEIAASLGESSSKLQTAWQTYKKLVAEMMMNANGAA